MHEHKTDRYMVVVFWAMLGVAGLAVGTALWYVA